MATRKPKINVIENTGAVSGFRSNHATLQKLIFRIGEHKFKISIRSECYDFQSFATLSKWTDAKGFEVIISKNPKRDYGIDASSMRSVPADVFEPIVVNLNRLAIEFVA